MALLIDFRLKARMCPTPPPFCVCFFICPGLWFKADKLSNQHAHIHILIKRSERKESAYGPYTQTQRTRYTANLLTERKFKGIERAFEIDWRSYFFVYIMYETLKNIIQNGSILRRLNSIISILYVCVAIYTRVCCVFCVVLCVREWVCAISVYTLFDESMPESINIWA